MSAGIKPAELDVLEMDELDGRLKDSRRELYELRFKLAVGQLDDHRQILKVRKDIARIMTFIRQRQHGILPARGVETPAAQAGPATGATEKETEG